MSRLGGVSAASASDPSVPDLGGLPPAASAGLVWVRRRGLQEYLPTWRAMRALAGSRSAGGTDEVWLLEHPPVYTFGQAARGGQLRDPAGVPVVHTDRGGQVTYHGPGQLICYLILCLRPRQLGIRGLVTHVEEAIIGMLASLDVNATRRSGAPGVYVSGRKIAALGLRVSRGVTYHGLALNVNMDLAPFERIDPCGYPGLPVTQIADEGRVLTMDEAGDRLLAELLPRLGAVAVSHS